MLYFEYETRTRLAVADARAATDAPIALLAVWREAGRKAGLSLEATPDTRTDSATIDFVFFIHDRQHGKQLSMREYPAWEERLPAQIARDGEAQFRISQRPNPRQAEP